MMDGWMDGWMDINNESPRRRWLWVADTSQTMLREEAAGRKEVGGPGTQGPSRDTRPQDFTKSDKMGGLR